MKSITITIANHKGGVGKTTTAVTIATGLALRGHPVILVDCDPQGNVGQFLGMEPAPGLYDLLVARTEPVEIIGQPLGETYPDNLGVVLGDASTVDVETLMRTSPRFDPTVVLWSALRPFENSNNGPPTIIVIDTSPSLSSVQVAALCAADWLLIPASPEYASETGISALTNAIEELQEAGAGVQLLGILPTLVDSRSKEHAQTIADLRVAFPDLILPPVRRRIALAEAPRSGEPIWMYNSDAAQDYADVLVQVAKRVGVSL